MSNHDEQYALAQAMASEIESALADIDLSGIDPDELRWYVEEHIGDPLEISATLSSVSLSVLYGWESANLTDYVDEIDVLLGTGGPARGIVFTNGHAYPWHQDWGTPRVRTVEPLSDHAYAILASVWMLDGES